MSRLFEALAKIQRKPIYHTETSEAFHSNAPSGAPSGLDVMESTSSERTKPADPVRGSSLGIDDARSVAPRPSPTSRLVALTDPKTIGAEKFRALATRLDHLRKGSLLKSLQVTSSVINEGKTLVAANLAVTFAKYARSRTLLVEGDLHRPTLGSVFGFGQLDGISHWWSKPEQPISTFLRRCDDMPLWFLAAGEPYDRPSEILRSARLRASLVKLLDHFDWVVVDSPPLLPIVDANLWSRFVDATLLIVREGVAPIAALKKGLRALDHPKWVGLVVNDSSEAIESKHEGRYYDRHMR